MRRTDSRQGYTKEKKKKRERQAKGKKRWVWRTRTQQTHDEDCSPALGALALHGSEARSWTSIVSGTGPWRRELCDGAACSRRPSCVSACACTVRFFGAACGTPNHLIQRNDPSGTPVPTCSHSVHAHPMIALLPTKEEGHCIALALSSQKAWGHGEVDRFEVERTMLLS